MSKIFYDNFLDLGKIDKAIKKVSHTNDEKIELWQIVDEIVHYRVMSCVLDNLPKEYHREFLELFQNAPYDEELLDYLKKKIGKDVKLLIHEVVAVLVFEIVGKMGVGKSVKFAKG